jgi:hypothetical protein
MTEQGWTPPRSRVNPATGSDWFGRDASAWPWRPYRSASTRSIATIAALAANGILAAIATLHALGSLDLIDRYLAGTATDADLVAFDDLFAQIGLLQTVAFFVAAIAWLAWQSRSLDNESALRIGPPEVSPRWSIATWFIPFVNLVMPYRTMRGLYRHHHGGSSSGLRLVQAWWAAYLVSNIGANVAGRVWVLVDDPASFEQGLLVWAASDFLTVTAAMLAIVLVRDIQARADRLATLAGPTLSTPPGTEDAAPVAPVASAGSVAEHLAPTPAVDPATATSVEPTAAEAGSP